MFELIKGEVYPPEEAGDSAWQCPVFRRICEWSSASCDDMREWTTKPRLIVPCEMWKWVNKLFDQFMRWMLPLDWLQLGKVVISEAYLQGKSTTYQIAVQNITISALLDTGINISVMSEKCFR